MNAWFESWTGYRLAEPGWLALLGLLPVVWFARYRIAAASVMFAPLTLFRSRSDADGSPMLPRSWRERGLVLPFALEAAGVALVVVALARPVERVPLPLETEGIDILLCLDVSSSMTANDLDPRRTRLDVTKEAAARFALARDDDRIGFLCFARYPDLRCPLTLDHDAVAQLLADVALVEHEGPEDATGIGTAIARAAQVLRGSDAMSKVIVLLTDGEENVASTQTPNEIAPVHAAQLCRDNGIRVYTIAAGIGRQTPSGFERVDTTQVERVAQMTGGRFFRARDADALLSVYAAIDALETAPFEEPRYRLEERFVAFVLAALAAWVVARLLRASVFEVLP